LAIQVLPKAVQAQLRVGDPAQESQQSICRLPRPEAPDRLQEPLQGQQQPEPSGTVHG